MVSRFNTTDGIDYVTNQGEGRNYPDRYNWQGSAAYVTGSVLARLRPPGLPAAALAFLAGCAAVYACGIAWLDVLMGDPGAALRAGLLPFALFDLAKIVVATGIYAGYMRWKARTPL